MAGKNNNDFIVNGNNPKALFNLKIYRGDGMALLGMNWKKGKPPMDFAGFSIEYKEPGGQKFYALKNRLSFPDEKGKVTMTSTSTLISPIQKFRWVHFPRNANMEGEFVYRVKPVFMNPENELSYGEEQQVSLALKRQTYKNQLNIAFTRGFVSSQAFVDRYDNNGGISTLLPPKSKEGLDFTPTHPEAKEALVWMGFEAYNAIIELLDNAIADKKSQVMMIAYDLDEPEIVSRLEKLGSRLRIIIDDSGSHKTEGSAENEAQKRLEITSPGNVKREHMSQLQHNKTIVTNGPKVKAVVCGSTNFSWRGFFVQSNNAIILYGSKAIKPFLDAFDNYWKYPSVKQFGSTASTAWNDLMLTGIKGSVSFSPHAENNARLDKIADDIKNHTQSNIFYSLSFLYEASGSLRDAITAVTHSNKIFVYGVSDKKVGGLDVQKPDGNVAPVYPSQLSKNLPEPFRSEPTGGSGVRMHHKFIVIDFDKPTARVFMGSYNFSPTADEKNGENLLLFKDRKIAVSYMIEALTIFDHYHFRVSQNEAKKGKKILALTRPPRKEGEAAWWEEYYTDRIKIRDRELFG